MLTHCHSTPVLARLVRATYALAVPRQVNPDKPGHDDKGRESASTAAGMSYRDVRRTGAA